MNLRGPNYDFNPELKELEYLVKSKNTGVMETMKELRSRTNVIPFIIMATMIIFQVRDILDSNIIHKIFYKNYYNL